jgi:hypothetical protein
MRMPSRSRRRSDRLRIKSRMLRIWFLYPNARFDLPELSWWGVMISTHGKPCSCRLGCGNRRSFEGPSVAEQRQRDRGSEDWGE